MEAHVDAVYEAFNARRKALAAAEANEADKELFAVTDDSSELAEFEKQLEKREK
jgi:hypothetical protein